MANKENLLTSPEVAQFVAKGFLRFDGIIPDDVNAAAMKEIEAGVTSAPAGTPLSQCYLPPSTLGQILRMPRIQGIIESLVGPDPLFDHQAVHIRQPNQDAAQQLHADSIIDTRNHFDIQLMYYPHDVPLDMGGTLLLPGSHFRRVNESDIARYQNIVGQIPMVCKAGTILVLHHGIWHCGRQNKTNQARYMFKVRLNPAVRQLRLWNTDDLTEETSKHQVIFGPARKGEPDIQAILGQQEPWFEWADSRLEIVNRIRLWRFLTGEDAFDVHYWLTRIENMPENVLDPVH